MYDTYLPYIEANAGLMSEACDTIWANPETGYKEWKTHRYLKEKMEELGYTLREAGDIPGFTADLDTGRPGPVLVLMAELDALTNTDHPDCDRETGAVHACGHCAQTASLLGAAAALRQGGTEKLSGRIRFMFVPAEELMELGWREELRRNGTIRYFGGKPEFMYRGFFDGVDLCVMLHTGAGKDSFSLNPGQNGCIVKQIVYRGTAAHAGGAPHKGINALYAAQLGMSAVNALRETFRDEDHIRWHPIITGRADAVNVIPACITMESYIRGASLAAMKDANKKANRAIAASAAAMGAKVEIIDRPGYCPVNNDPNMFELTRRVMCAIVGEENVRTDGWGTGCTDMGDISCVFPAVHPHGSGAEGTAHGADYRIADKKSALKDSAAFFCGMAEALLSDNAKEAKYILENKNTLFKSIPEYLKAVDELTADIEGVEYTENGAKLSF